MGQQFSFHCLVYVFIAKDQGNPGSGIIGVHNTSYRVENDYPILRAHRAVFSLRQRYLKYLVSRIREYLLLPYSGSHNAYDCERNTCIIQNRIGRYPYNSAYSQFLAAYHFFTHFQDRAGYGKFISKKCFSR